MSKTRWGWLIVAGLMGLSGWVGPGWAAPPARALAVEAGLDEATVTQVLEVGSNPRLLVPAPRRGKPQPARGLTVQVPRDRAVARVEALSRQLGPGTVVFISQRRHGIARQPDEVSVLRSTDPLEPLRVMNTQGPAVALSAQRVLAKLRDWDRRYGVELLGAGPDWLQLRLKRLPDAPRRFAVEVYVFCPDAVSDTQSVDRLSEELQLTRTLYLGWGTTRELP